MDTLTYVYICDSRSWKIKSFESNDKCQHSLAPLTSEVQVQVWTQYIRKNNVSKIEDLRNLQVFGNAHALAYS